jgi:drug/metabolite transporter superfamily protein YnfA
MRKLLLLICCLCGAAAFYSPKATTVRRRFHGLNGRSASLSGGVQPKLKRQLVCAKASRLSSQSFRGWVTNVVSPAGVAQIVRICKIFGLFILAGLAEIGGGWMVWKSCREGKPWWWSLVGALILVGYGFIPTLQPIEDFGRLYAVYGGIFIGMSFAWGRVFDGMRPDMGDIIGSITAFAGVAIVLFWPRKPGAPP